MHVDNCVFHKRKLHKEFKEFRNLINHECITLHGIVQHNENELLDCRHCSIFLTPYIIKHTRIKTKSQLNKLTLFFYASLR